jgi:hypothetical protein
MTESKVASHPIRQNVTFPAPRADGKPNTDNSLDDVDSLPPPDEIAAQMKSWSRDPGQRSTFGVRVGY